MSTASQHTERTILHVDDDPMQLDLVEEYVSRHFENYDIINTSHPDRVDEYLADTQIDCVISDYEMPGTDGLELLTEIRADNPELPFVLYTGKGSEAIASKAINEGVTGYLQKGGPDQLDRLANRVEHAVTEYRARRESERYATVLQALNYPIYVVDENAEFAYVNDAFVDVTGYTREEIIGAKPGLVKTDAGVAEANEALRSIVSSSGPTRATFEVDIHTKDGDIVPCRDHMAALPFTDTFRGSVGILRDISEQEQQRKQLQAQNERLEEIVSFISHDLRTPLSQAQVGAQLARESGDPQDFERVESGLSRIESMIDDLREMAETGITVNETAEVRIHQVASRAWRTLSRESDHIEIEPFTVEADPERTASLIENLLRNAVEHTDPGVSIRLGRLDGPKDAAETTVTDGFFIADDGPGIPADEREQILEAGYTTAKEGTGFGLSIIKRVAESHGWELAVTESRDGGARFEIRDANVGGVDTEGNIEMSGTTNHSVESSP